MEITLDLPMPPPLNSIWRKNKRRKGGVYLNPKYVAWKSACDKLMYLNHTPEPILGRFSAKLILNEKMMRANSDLDGRFKVVADYAVSLSLVQDDCIKFMRSVTIELGDAPEGARLILVSL